MDDHLKAKGDKSTLAVMLAMHELGLPFLVPLGEDTATTSCWSLRLNSRGCSTRPEGFERAQSSARHVGAYDHHPYSKPSRDYSGHVAGYEIAKVSVVAA